MKSKILATTLVGLLFGLAACDKPQEKVTPATTDNQNTGQVEQVQADAEHKHTTETQDGSKVEVQQQNTQTGTAKAEVAEEVKAIAEGTVVEDTKEKYAEKIQSTDDQKISVDVAKDEGADKEAKQVKKTKASERSEVEKIIAILESQYQSVRCAEGQESGYCLEESQRLKSEIERLKAQLSK